MFGRKKETVPTSKDDVVASIKKGFANADVKYNFDQEKSIFSAVFMGNDLPISTNIYVDDMALHFICLLDLQADSDNYDTVAWNLNSINKSLVFGAFYLDPEDGGITFEYGFPYVEARVSPEFVMGLLNLMIKTVDENDGELKTMAEKINRNTDSMFA